MQAKLSSKSTITADSSGEPAPRPRFTGLRLLPDNDAAWSAKRHLVATARRTLDVTYFILEVDGSTSRLMLDLIEATERGVQVRLMVDYFTTYLQVPALRLLGQAPNLQVRRYGAPTAVWLAALAEAGIDPAGFIKALMAANGAALVQALKGNTIFSAAATAPLKMLHSAPGEAAVDFPQQVLAALQSTAPALKGTDRAQAVRKVALVIQVLRGLKRFLHRNHHKLLLADGQRFIMGGRNLADAYHCRRSAASHHFQDADLLARDGLAGGSSHLLAFAKLWGSAQAMDIRQADPLDARPALTLAELRQTALPVAPHRPGAAFRRGVKLPDLDGHFVDNLPSEKGDTSITLAYVSQIRRLIDSGRHEAVDIVNAYLCPSDDASDSRALLELRNSLVAAVVAGLQVNIYTNSLASTDLRPVNRAAYPKLVALMEAGVRAFELRPGQGSLHSKAAAIGNNCLAIGSYNMDPRSELYDTNNLIVLTDPTGAATAAFRRTCIRRLKWAALTLDEARQLASASTPLALRARITRSLL